MFVPLGPLWETRVALPGWNTAAARAALRIPISVCSISLCPFVVMPPKFAVFNVCTDVDACDSTQGLYGHRKRVCTESWTLIEKSLAAPGTRTRVSIAPGFSVGRSTNWAIPATEVQGQNVVDQITSKSRTHCCNYCSLLHSAVFHSRADSLRSCRVCFWISVLCLV